MIKLTYNKGVWTLRMGNKMLYFGTYNKCLEYQYKALKALGKL